MAHQSPVQRSREKVLWNTIYMQAVIDQLRAEDREVSDADVARLSPFNDAHINMLGRYSLDVPDAVAREEFRELRRPTDEDAQLYAQIAGQSPAILRFLLTAVLVPLHPEPRVRRYAVRGLELAGRRSSSSDRSPHFRTLLAELRARAPPVNDDLSIKQGSSA